MFRCGGGGDDGDDVAVYVIAIVGANVNPLLYSVQMLMNAPNGCLQISFLDV